MEQSDHPNWARHEEQDGSRGMTEQRLEAQRYPIPYVKPSITELEIAYVNDAIRTGWGPRCYDYINRLEADFAKWLGVKHAVATSSCTGALHMGLHALGIGPGDEVILADTNWIASVAPVVHLGATPVFVDILEDSWCLDPIQVEAAITSRTKAILAVHIYGNLCEMDRLRKLASDRGIPLIEDAAEAIGSVWKGARAGSMGKFGVFSFHGTKTVTTGEGGMFATNDDALYERVRALNNHGRHPAQTKQFWADEIGFKYRMSNLDAALGCAQLERVEDLVARKREILAGYRKRLSAVQQISLNPEPVDGINGAWMPTAVYAPEAGVTREALLAAFKSRQIDARVFFYPLSDQPMFSPVQSNTRARDISSRAINLPSFYDMTETDLDCVVSTLLSFVKD